MFDKHRKQTLKVFLAIALAFVLVKYTGPQIFLGMTPRLNPNLAQDLLQYPKNFIASLSNLRFNFGGPANRNADEQFQYAKVQNVPANELFNAVSKGVSASENNSYIKFEAGTKFKVYKYKTSSGKEVEIMVPE